MTVRDALEDVVTRFSQAGSDKSGACMEDPVFEAELLLAHVLGIERWRLRLEPFRLINPLQYRSFFSLSHRRLQGEPSAYLLGIKEFWSRTFNVSHHTLIPRPETELIVETAIYLAENGALPVCQNHDRIPYPMIFDAGTGSGILAVTLALEIPGAMVIASDISFRALEVAVHNIYSFRVRNRVLPVNCNWCACLRNKPFFDLVVSNPPYVGWHEKCFMEREVLDHEPVTALFAHGDGLDAIRELLEQVPSILKPGGWFLCEIGFMQGEEIRRLARENSRFSDIEIKKDLAGRDRMLAVRTVMV